MHIVNKLDILTKKWYNSHIDSDATLDSLRNEGQVEEGRYEWIY